jgi:Zinc-finger domain of monoamine-oxidase A repressor R1
MSQLNSWRQSPTISGSTGNNRDNTRGLFDSEITAASPVVVALQSLCSPQVRPRSSPLMAPGSNKLVGQISGLGGMGVGMSPGLGAMGSFRSPLFLSQSPSIGDDGHNKRKHSLSLGSSMQAFELPMARKKVKLAGSPDDEGEDEESHVMSSHHNGRQEYSVNFRRDSDSDDDAHRHGILMHDNKMSHMTPHHHSPHHHHLHHHHHHHGGKGAGPLHSTVLGLAGASSNDKIVPPSPSAARAGAILAKLNESNAEKAAHIRRSGRKKKSKKHDDDSEMHIPFANGAPDSSGRQAKQAAAPTTPSSGRKSKKRTPKAKSDTKTSRRRRTKKAEPKPEQPTRLLAPPKAGNGSGSSCHQCKSRRKMVDLVICKNMFTRRTDKTKKVCRKKYCWQCLLKFYHEQAPENRHGADSTWECPSCRLLCSCALCRRHRKENGVTPKAIANKKAQHAASTKAAAKKKAAKAAANAANAQSTASASASASATPSATPSASASASASTATPSVFTPASASTQAPSKTDSQASNNASSSSSTGPSPNSLPHTTMSDAASVLNALSSSPSAGPMSSMLSPRPVHFSGQSVSSANQSIKTMTALGATPPFSPRANAGLSMSPLSAGMPLDASASLAFGFVYLNRMGAKSVNRPPTFVGDDTWKTWVSLYQQVLPDSDIAKMVTVNGHVEHAPAVPSPSTATKAPSPMVKPEDIAAAGAFLKMSPEIQASTNPPVLPDSAMSTITNQ